ncbi:MAG: PDZ domain-containing protein [Pseudonocardiaceae bacterium]
MRIPPPVLGAAVAVTAALTLSRARAGYAGTASATPAPAGLQPGEIITAVNNTPAHSTAELAAVLAHLNPGQRVPVTVADQQGQTRTLMVTLGQLLGS